MKMVGEILSKIGNLVAFLLLCAKSTCFCSDLSCKNMMVSFSCLVSFGSLISKREYDQLFRASYATGYCPNNSSRLNIEVLYTVILNNFSMDFDQI